MSLALKDAFQVVQNVSTQNDGAGNLAPVHVPASIVGGIATPVSSSNPLPVEVAAGAAAIDGSGTITTGGAAQTLFAGVTPINGFQIANNSPETLYVSDVNVAGNGGASMPIAAGVIYTTPTGYRPAGQVSLYGDATGQAFAARRW